MTSKIFLLILLCLIVSTLTAQTDYGLSALSLDQYKYSVAKNPDKRLLNLAEFIPTLTLDIKYATSENFTHSLVYKLARAYARKPVADALQKAQSDFEKLGYSIKIYDAYRPYSATIKFYELMKGDTTYVASPYKGSRHNRGCAIDMTIVERASGRELQMPSAYDAMQKESWPSTPVADPQVRKNREILIQVMEKNGFKVYSTEWWHFDFVGWEKFEVMNVDFEDLERK